MNTSMSSCPDSRAKNKAKNIEHFSQLIVHVIDGLAGKERLGEEEIEDAWREAAGEAAAKHSKPVSFKKAVLAVNVANSSLLYELSVRKKDLLESLSARLKGKKVREIRFRIGEIKKS